MTKFMVLIFATFGALTVHAAESAAGSEFMHQTPVGKFELTGGLVYQSTEYNAKKAKAGFYSAETKGWMEALSFEYGLADDFSAGLNLSMASKKFSYSPSSIKSTTKSGLYDPEVYFHGKLAMGPGLLRYGIDASFALAKEKFESNNDSNNATGALGLKPFVGYEMASGACKFGGRFSYKTYISDLKRTDESSTPTENYTGDGGQQTRIDGFYEHSFSEKFMIGGLLGFHDVAKITFTEDSNSSSKAYVFGMDVLALRAYGRYTVGGNVDILPIVEYEKALALNNVYYESIKGWSVGTAARFAF